MRPATRTEGFTLIELLVGMVLLAIILGVVLNTTLSTMTLYRTDQARLGANRNARSTLDILNSDIQQAGERLGESFPAITVTKDAAGNSVLTLRRGLLDAPLPVCAPLPNADGIYVTANGTVASPFPAGISALPDSCGTSAQDLSAWRSQISSGVTSGYLYDVTGNVGSSLRLSGTETQAAAPGRQTVKYSGTVGAYNPRKTTASDRGRDIRLYLLEGRRYGVTAGNLTLSVNDAPAQDATPRVLAFRVVPYLRGKIGSPVPAALPFPPAPVVGTETPTWKDLAYLDVTLSVQQGQGRNTVQRTFTERLTPRNANSSE
ncbi:PilW family protein [Deinococcus frigens]|uniref:PilW family protein n=1 Tax=Deinococcus frigens TaxID=249403 RepID=UPI000495409C|nr:prepilin-type N-terminal cleavage/methylation domain-containing protein [Deinococcus frigens]